MCLIDNKFNRRICLLSNIKRVSRIDRAFPPTSTMPFPGTPNRVHFANVMVLFKTETFVLFDDEGNRRVIMRDDPESVRQFINDDKLFGVFIHNRVNRLSNKRERICPSCRKQYLIPEICRSKTEKEMEISGTCSDACWDRATYFD